MIEQCFARSCPPPSEFVHFVQQVLERANGHRAVFAEESAKNHGDRIIRPRDSSCFGVGRILTRDPHP
jgi:hypothetical protein